jgi:hypothetical protein
MAKRSICPIGLPVVDASGTTNGREFEGLETVLRRGILRLQMCSHDAKCNHRGCGCHALMSFIDRQLFHLLNGNSRISLRVRPKTPHDGWL